MGKTYGISEANCWKIIQKIEKILLESSKFQVKNIKEVSPDIEEVIIDATEVEIQNIKREKNLYSGKKKNSIKVQVVFNKQKNTILNIDFCAGAIHDFQLLKDSKINFSDSTKVLVDKGYQGIAKLFSNIEIGKKRSKNKSLSQEDKELNKLKSSKRIVIENLFAHLKKFSILANKFRSSINSFISKFKLISGFYNFEKSL